MVIDMHKYETNNDAVTLNKYSLYNKILYVKVTSHSVHVCQPFGPELSGCEYKEISIKIMVRPSSEYNPKLHVSLTVKVIVK